MRTCKRTSKRTPLILASLCLLLASMTAQAQFAVEEADENGVVNPADFSWRYYVDKMNRAPDQIGIICGNAYLLDKTGDYTATLGFFEECARRGNPPAMIYLSTLHEHGRGTPRDPARATGWIRRAAETGYALAQFHYGVALLRGHGVARDEAEGRAWIGRAATANNPDAAALIAAGYDLTTVPGLSEDRASAAFPPSPSSP